MVRIFALAALTALAMSFAPAARAGTVTVDVCAPALSDAALVCGTPVPQGAPWVIYRVDGLGASEPVTVTAACTFAGTTSRWFWCYDVDVNPTNAGFTAGEQTVVVTDAATGTELARATYTVTPQTPEEALAAFRGGHSTWARAGTVLALARGGQLEQALAAAQAMMRDTDAGTQFMGYTLSIHVLLAVGRPAEAEALARALIDRWRPAHGASPQPQDWRILAVTAIAACDLGTAERALAQVSLLAPRDATTNTLLARVERLREQGACASNSLDRDASYGPPVPDLGEGR
jgi:hypothetical protein